MRYVRAKTCLKNKRISCGYSISKFSELTKIDISSLSRIENRKKGLHPNTAKRITTVLQCSFDDVFEII